MHVCVCACICPKHRLAMAGIVWPIRQAVKRSASVSWLSAALCSRYNNGNMGTWRSRVPEAVPACWYAHFDIYVTVTIHMRYIPWSLSTSNKCVQGRFHPMLKCFCAGMLDGFYFFIFPLSELSLAFATLSAYSHLPCVHYHSHISPLEKNGSLREASLCEGCAPQTAGNRSASRSDVLLPLCAQSGSLQLFSVYLPHVALWLHALN